MIDVLDVVIIFQCGNIRNRRTPLRAAHIKGTWCCADFKGLRRMTDKTGLAVTDEMIRETIDDYCESERSGHQELTLNTVDIKMPPDFKSESIIYASDFLQP